MSGTIKTVTRNITIATFIVYFLLLIYLTLFSKYFGREYFHRSINLIPFVTINRYLISSVSLGLAVRNIVGNIVAFVPFGALLPIAVKRQKCFFLIMISTFSASIAIEISQYILGVGVSDVDDVILNVTGGILGYCIFKIFNIINTVKIN